MARRLAERYLLGDQIGAGGTARVHEAVDERLGRRVAVKLLDASRVASADPAGRERFVNEGRTSAEFNHRNAVTVYDAGEDDGELFIVMELVQGESLAEHLARVGPMPIADVVDVARQLLAVLSSAHAVGVVHRDVKPANVLLGPPDGHGGSSFATVKLADFGIAKRFDDLDSSVTATGVVMGTPRYLAPEQAVGTAVTPATDVYALGTVLYEMLTGRPPFEADSLVSAALVQQTRPAPDVREARPEVPTALAAVVAQALEREPGARFVDARAMARALDGAWASGASSPEASVPTRAMGAVAAAAAPAAGRRSGDTRVLQAVAAGPLPPPPGAPGAPGTGRRSHRGGRPGHEVSGDQNGSTGRTAALLVFVLAMVVGVVAVAVASGNGDRGELLADGVPPGATTVPVTGADDGDAAGDALVDGDEVSAAPTDPPSTEPEITEPPATDPPVTEPPVTEPAVVEIIPGFPATDDLAQFLTQLEADPFLVGEEGDDLAEDLRDLLETRGEGRQRREARDLRKELREWAEDGEIHPDIAAALDELLAPIADR